MMIVQHLDQGQLKPQTADKAAARPAPAGPLAIAIADDEPEMLDFLERVLTFSGHRVVVRAETGRQLVEQCCAAPVDLIITDVRMPGINGLEALAQIERERPIPAILISAHDFTEMPPATISRSVVACLQKPVKRRDIDAAVSHVALWLSPRRATPEE